MAEKTGFSRRDLKGPDEFISTFGRTVDWCKENRTKSPRGRSASSPSWHLCSGPGRTCSGRRTSPPGIYGLPWTGRSSSLQVPSAADPSQLASVEQFLKGHVSAQSPNTRAALYSLYYLGSIAFSRGDYDLAVTHLRAGIATGKEAGIMKYLLRAGIASSLEARGDLAAAAAAYRDAAAVAEPNMKSQARMGEARVLGLAGKKTEAMALYRLILEENPETPLRDLVEIRLAQSG